MSYILDALKRADAERERGHVPGLHSQRAAALSATSHEPAPQASRRARAAAAVVLLLTAASAVWWWWSGSDRSPPAEHLPAPAIAPVLPDPPPTPPLAAPQVEAAAPPAPVLPILAPPVPGAAAARSRSETADPMAMTAPPAAAASGPDAVRQPTELTPDARAALPKLSVSGATYSANPEHRMLIVNGQVVREGQTIEPGLVLETISSRSAVFNHNGTRFNVNF